MTTNEIKKYYINWKGTTESTVLEFSENILRRCTWALRENKKINLNGKMRTGKEISIIFDQVETLILDGILK